MSRNNVVVGTQWRPFVDMTTAVERSERERSGAERRRRERANERRGKEWINGWSNNFLVTQRSRDSNCFENLLPIQLEKPTILIETCLQKQRTHTQHMIGITDEEKDGKSH